MRQLRGNEAVVSWRASGNGVEVDTGRERIAAGALVLTAGAWTSALAQLPGLPLEVRRQPLFWFEPQDGGAFAPKRFPIFIWEHERGRFVYGFPDFGDGVKLARHMEGEPTTGDAVRREVAGLEAEEVRATAARLVPDACGRPLGAAVCLYTNTPDGHFVIDAHPEHPNVWIASPCSGHGFKFASVVGEIMADLADGGLTGHNISLFRLERLRRPADDQSWHGDSAAPLSAEGPENSQERVG